MIGNHLYNKLLYFYFQDYIFDLPVYERDKYISKGVVRKAISIAQTLILSVKAKSNKLINTDCIADKNWIFVFDKNNYDATNFFDDGSFVFVTDRKRDFLGSEKVIQLPYRLRLTHYLKFPFIFFFLLRNKGKRAYEICDLLFKSIGWMEAFDQVIRKYKPKSIIFSNDHSFIPRALLLAAKENNTPTIYIQHATVTSSFPPLEFDLNLLEGEDALAKYQLKGISGQVKFIGMPRFDKFYLFRKKMDYVDIKTIGLAFNTVDSIPKIAVVVEGLVKSFPLLNIIVRKHSKDKRDFKTPLDKIGENVFFSDSLVEAAFDFILKCDVVIAGDSAIHLDACMVNVESYLYDFSEGSKIKDLYGFLKRGFVKELTGLEDVIALIRNGLSGNNVFIKARHYNHLIGTELESKASRLAIEEVQNFLKKKGSGDSK